VSKTSLLALQAIGGSAGNGICLNNIIAACAVVGLDVGEGAILKQTYKFVLGITTLSTIIMLGFFLRF
jgi:lactate permease